MGHLSSGISGIGTDHLLVGMASVPNTSASRALRSVGVTAEGLEEKLISCRERCPQKFPRYEISFRMQQWQFQVSTFPKCPKHVKKGPAHQRSCRKPNKLFHHLWILKFISIFVEHQAVLREIGERIDLHLMVGLHLPPETCSRHAEMATCARWNSNARNRTHNAWLLAFAWLFHYLILNLSKSCFFSISFHIKLWLSDIPSLVLWRLA